MKGRKYVYPNFFILVTGYIRTYFHLPYRQTEGIIKATGKSLPNHPYYKQICKRVNKLELDINNNEIDDDDDDDDGLIIAAVDSSGIKVTNRGQWMSDKWRNIPKKGYLKIHVAVNIKTKEILALEVTDEKVHDSKVMTKLVESVSKSNDNHIKIKSVLADGASDTNTNFQFLEEKRITPGIKVRRNSIVSPSNNKTRNKEVRQQTKDFLLWKKKRKYGHRWIVVETIFSSIKRMFGEYISAAIRYQNMIKEMVMKVSLYNLFRSMA